MTEDLSSLDLLSDKEGFSGPTFKLSNRVKRLCWKMSWAVLARWTPPGLHRWRIGLLRVWGARVAWTAYIYPDVDVWAPWHLQIDAYGTLGPRVTCYNIAPVHIGQRAVVSQGAHLCTGTHDYRDPAFPLVARRITVGRRAWVCAEAFVGPGVDVGEGAVLSARAVAFADLPVWTVSMGNPAVFVRERALIQDR